MTLYIYQSITLLYRIWTQLKDNVKKQEVAIITSYFSKVKESRIICMIANRDANTYFSTNLVLATCLSD